MSSFQKSHQPNQAQRSPRTRKLEHGSRQKVNPEQMREAPETLRHDDLLAAQQQLGNQVVQRALDESAQREPPADGQGNLHPEVSDSIQQARSGGSQLPADVQAEMSRKFKRKFGKVRLHTDAQADKLSRRIRARAFTIGNDIFFKNGVYAPGTPAGRETLVHELTHVVQQSASNGGTNGRLRLGGKATPQEHEAERISRDSAPVKGAASRGAVQTQGEEEELQMQAEEEEEIQMQAEEEEEIQMQAEEEEVQMQPDGPVVQRQKMWIEDKEKGGYKRNPDYKKPEKDESKPLSPGPIPEAPKMTPKMQLETVSQLAKESYTKPETPSLGQKIKSAFAKKPPSMEEELQAKAKQVGKTSQKATAKLDEQVSKKQLGFAKAEIQDPQKKKETDYRAKLMGTINDTSAKPEDIKSARERMKTLFGDKEAGMADKNRATKLQNLAKGGDEEAFKTMQAEKEEAEKNSKWGKFKGFMGKAWGMAKEKLPGLIGGALGGAKEHFMGKEKEEEGDKAKGGSPVTVNVGQGGGGGGGNAFNTMAEKYAEEVQKNKELQAKIKDLESKMQPVK